VLNAPCLRQWTSESLTIAELAAFGLELAEIRAWRDETNARRDLDALRRAGVLSGELARRLQRPREKGRWSWLPRVSWIGPSEAPGRTRMCGRPSGLIVNFRSSHRHVWLRWGGARLHASTGLSGVFIHIDDNWLHMSRL
jgi:hypothetical protein